MPAGWAGDTAPTTRASRWPRRPASRACCSPTTTPTRTEDALDAILAGLRAERAGRDGPEVIMAHEGLSLEI